MTPCPAVWCLRVMEGATACFAAGWLVWVPIVLLGRPLPVPMKWLAIALTVAGCMLALGVATWTCHPCGG